VPFRRALRSSKSFRFHLLHSVAHRNRFRLPESDFDFQFPGGLTARVTPVPIPNTEVKPCRADDTALETTRERRSPPGLNFRGRIRESECGLFIFARSQPFRYSSLQDGSNRKDFGANPKRNVRCEHSVCVHAPSASSIGVPGENQGRPSYIFEDGNRRNSESAAEGFEV
jgi:hypothetical protein